MSAPAAQARDLVGPGRRHRRSSHPGGISRAPAQRAAARMFTVNLAVGVLALASFLFVGIRLAESWRVGAPGGSHSVSLLGQTWSYPVANAGAVGVTALAVLGLVVLVVAIRAAVRETRADAAFRRVLAELAPSSTYGAGVVDDDRPRAFCAGLLRPRVYISRGALEMLSDAELAAVLAHERHHARRRDPLRLASARVLADALFFVPQLRGLVQQQHSLAEIGADEAAVAVAGGDRSPLAGAMLTFSEAVEQGGGGLDPARIDQLVGERPERGFPLVPLLVICFSLSVLVTLAALLAETARGSATLAPPVVSAKPCVVMLSLIPAAVTAAGLLCGRLRTSATRAAVRRDVTQD